jgi:1-acyl-sn-glycerol-3-phosphate acyltransferase
MTGPRALDLPRTRKKPSTLFLVVYNVFYWPYLIGTTALIFWIALVIFLFTFAWDRHLRVLHRFTSLWAAHYLAWAPWAGVTVEGKEHVREDRAYIYVSNHQSMVDILACFATHLDYKWVSKIENFYAPFIGWAMVLNRYVALRRGHLPSIMKMFRRSEELLKEGDSLFVFPEGTRSPDGNLQTFFRGAFVLAVRNKVPIVPVIIEGTGEILGKGSTKISPRPVLVRVMEPIDPGSVDYDDRRLRDRVHEVMEQELAKIRG